MRNSIPTADDSGTRDMEHTWQPSEMSVASDDEMAIFFSIPNYELNYSTGSLLLIYSSSWFVSENQPANHCPHCFAAMDQLLDWHDCDLLFDDQYSSTALDCALVQEQEEMAMMVRKLVRHRNTLRICVHGK